MWRIGTKYCLLLVVSCSVSSMSVFFFQAEDGIRDLTVTGVQTCALPISDLQSDTRQVTLGVGAGATRGAALRLSYTFTDRKSTRLNSSHSQISYAVFCLKKKK